MELDTVNINQLLGEKLRYVVPIYQRNYQWSDDLLKSFWEDVSAKATELLNNDCKFDHYMGALILSPVSKRTEFSRTKVIQVVDGQQRLTTFQIILSALREVSRVCDCEELMKSIEGYTSNVPQAKDRDPLTKFKLTPNLSDRGMFNDIIEMPYSDLVEKCNKNRYFWGSRVPKNTEHPSLRAYIGLTNWVEDFVENGPEGVVLDYLNDEWKCELRITAKSSLIRERLQKLLEAILDRLKLVVIELGESDDAQVIFETLNSKSEPLLAMDLVKNNLFHRVENQGLSVEQFYGEHWEELDHPWWRDSAPNARPQRPRLDHFLANVLTAETGDSISVKELYSEYRAFVLPKGNPRYEKVDDEMKLLKRFSPIYEVLERRSDVDAKLSWLGEKLSEWQVTTAYPVAMRIGAEEIGDDEKSELIDLIYSYIVRRSLCGLTSKNLNKVFQMIVAEFINKGVSVKSFHSFFKDREGESIRFPDDKSLKQGILTNNAYAINPKTRLQDIFWELEMRSWPSKAERINKPADLSIEHVLPQTWTKEWPFEDGEIFNHDAAPEDNPNVIKRNSLIHTLGNLTLITPAANAANRNFSFNIKKRNFETSKLTLQKWIYDKSRWTETEIVERGNYFANLATEIWVGLE